MKLLEEESGYASHTSMLSNNDLFFQELMTSMVTKTTSVQTGPCLVNIFIYIYIKNHSTQYYTLSSPQINKGNYFMCCVQSIARYCPLKQKQFTSNMIYINRHKHTNFMLHEHHRFTKYSLRLIFNIF